MAFDYVPLWDRYKELFEPLEHEEIGRLVVAMMDYKAGDPPTITGNERFVWPSVRRDIDNARMAYEETCRKQSSNGAKGGRPKKSSEEEKPTAFFENPKNPVVFSKTQKSKNKDKVKDKDKVNIDSPNGEYTCERTVEAKKSFGAYGWVKLTESEYNRLLNDLGEAEVKRCIAYVDESAQATGNKNHWRDWNLVLRKCSRAGWGLQRPAALSPGGKREISDLERAAVRRLMEDTV